jgi:nucleotide-binding universal stress UspA family protein
MEEAMGQPERYDILVLGSGTGGKLVAWQMARAGRRTDRIVHLAPCPVLVVK